MERKTLSSNVLLLPRQSPTLRAICLAAGPTPPPAHNEQRRIEATPSRPSTSSRPSLDGRRAIATMALRLASPPSSQLRRQPKNDEGDLKVSGSGSIGHPTSIDTRGR